MMSSDGGLLVLREIEQRLGIAKRIAACIHDPRAPERIVHGLDEIIRFRMLMIAAGYEDGNDADSLRTDPLFKLAMDRLPDHGDLCSQSTVSRTENLPDRHALLRMGVAAQGSARGAGGMAAEGAPWLTTTARASATCRVASCSTSTIPSTPCRRRTRPSSPARSPTCRECSPERRGRCPTFTPMPVNPQRRPYRAYPNVLTGRVGARRHLNLPLGFRPRA